MNKIFLVAVLLPLSFMLFRSPVTQRMTHNPPSKYWWKPGNLPKGVHAQRVQPPLFDALTATAHDLQELLIAGKLKSTDLVEEYIWRIEEYNSYLRAVDQYALNVMERAREMDESRAAGQFLGPLHGIPVLLKVQVVLFQKRDAFLTNCEFRIPCRRIVALEWMQMLVPLLLLALKRRVML